MRSQSKESSASVSARQKLTILSFLLDEQRYALDASVVRELLPVCSVTPLPKAPSIVEGAINVRGRVVPVFNVRGRFGLRPSVASPAEHFIVARAGARVVAIRVDRALELASVDGSDIAKSDQLSTALEHVAGVVPTKDGLLLIHDLETFLTRAESEALDRALEAREVVEAAE